MMQPYYDADGSLMVWTGTGYHRIPKIAAGDVGERAVNSYYDENSSTGYGLNPTSSYMDGYQINDPAKYGLPTDSQVQFSPLGGGSQDSFSYLLKSGDKEGSNIVFQRQADGSYAPTMTGVSAWDTNDGKDSWLPLAIMAGGAGALYAGASGVGAGLGLTNSMTGAGGTALAGSADAMLYGGMTGAGGAAAGGGLLSTGAMNPYDAALMAGGEPIAGSGFSGASSGTTAFGQPFTTGATLSGAGEAAGSLFGLPNMQGVPGALAGGAFSGVNPLDLTSPTLGGSPGGAADFLAPGAASQAPGGAPPGGSSSLPSWMTPELLKLLGGVVGGLLGQETAGSSGSGSGGQRSTPPSVIPTMYGGNAQKPTFKPLGNTATEKYMAQQYLPGVFNQPTSGLLSEELLRRSLLG